jgi:hypothetical protein
MKMKRFEIELNGVTPLLHHRMTEEELFGLLGKKSNKKKDEEEQTPRQIAEKYAYKNGENYCIPTSYIVGAFRGIASEYKQKNSQRKSLKSIAGGIFRTEQEYADLVDDSGKPITNFEVDIRKATNHQKGAVAVCRPRFDRWKLKTTISVDTSLVSEDTILEMLNDAGKRSGIGSFRVSKGGYFGQFSVTKFEELTN